MAEADTLKFSGIVYGGKSGFLKFTAEQFGWQCNQPGAEREQVRFHGKELEAAEWRKSCARGQALLKMQFKSDSHVFVGLRLDQLPAVTVHLRKHFNVDLAETDIAAEGWSWGEWSIAAEQDLQVQMNGKLGVDIPITNLSQVAAIGRNELYLEFQDDDANDADLEVLHEVRFQVEGATGEEAPHERLRDELLQLGGLSTRGEEIARVENVQFVAPRAKHTLEFFPQVLRIRGKTQTYTVKFKNIGRLYLFEVPHSSQMNVVIGLTSPLRQGNQNHSWLVLIFDTAKEIANPSSVEERLTEVVGQDANMPQGEFLTEYTFVCGLLKALSKKAIIAPTHEFNETDEKNSKHCAKCSHKSNPGHIYMMKKSMMFCPKPVVWINYADVESVEFNMAIMRRTSFDLVVRLKRNAVYEFVQFERQLYERLFEFLKKLVRVVNEEEVAYSIASTRAPPGQPAPPRPPRRPGQEDAQDDAGGGDADEEDDDEDFEDSGDSGEDGSDGGEDDEEEDASDEDEEDEQPKKKRARK